MRITFIFLFAFASISYAEEKVLPNNAFIKFHDVSHMESAYKDGEAQRVLRWCKQPSQNVLECTLQGASIRREHPNIYVWPSYLEEEKLTKKGQEQLRATQERYCNGESLKPEIISTLENDKYLGQSERLATLAELKEIEKYCGKAAESKIISYFKKQIERIEGTCKYSSDQRMDISFNRSGINQWSFIHLGRSYYRLTKAEEDKSWKLVIEQEGYEGSIYTGYEYLTSSSEGAHIEFISYDTCKYMEFFQ